MPDLEDIRWLVSDDAVPWLARVALDLAGTVPTPAFVAKLRKELSAERVHLVIEQVELRQRARDKFSHADRMFFTRKGLEQATDEQIAAVKAAHFPAGQLLADLCCGIGGDLVALARRAGFQPDMETRRVSEGAELAIGIDLDPAIPLLAAANLSANQCDRAEVHSADAASFPVSEVAAWHIDPDRRASGSRTTKVEHYQPPLESLDRLLASNPNAAIKLAPAADVPTHWRDVTERCWLGSRGECRQQVAWFGSLAQHPGQHSATVVDAASGPQTLVGQPDEPIPVAESLGRYLYEPHAAILAAKLTGAICHVCSLAAVSREVAYLTSDKKINEPTLTAFEVIDVLPFDLKRLHSYCRERGVGNVELKKRGVQFDLERTRKGLSGNGERSLTIVVTPCSGKIQAIVVARDRLQS